MHFSNNVFIVLCVAILIVLLWLEVNRTVKNKLILRLICTTIAVGSLYFLLFPLSYKVVKNDKQTNNKWIFISKGTNEDSLKQFMLQSGINDTCSGNFLYQISKHLNKQPIVFGNGFSTNELNALEGKSFSFYPQLPTSGTIKINWKQHITTGEALNIQGEFINSFKNPVNIYLQVFGQNVDSFQISSASKQKFKLNAIPKLTGRIVYNVLVLNKQDTVENNPIPVQVFPPLPLNVLIVTSSPSFEQKFLINWCMQNNYKVISKTAISKQKFSNNFTNTSVSNINNISLNTLQNIDVFVTDASTINALNSSELKALNSHLSQNKMGCIVLVDTTLLNNLFLQKTYKLLPNNVMNKTHTLFFNNSKAALTQTNISMFFEPTNNEIQLVKDSLNNAYATLNLLGSGKYVLNTISDTYQWILQGRESIFSQFWTNFFNSVLPIQNSNQLLTIPFINSVHQPVMLHFTAFEPINNFLANNVPLSFQQSAVQPNVYYFTYWPNKVGWNSFVFNQSSVYYKYIYPQNAFLQVQAMEKIAATQAYCSQNLVNTNQDIFSTTIQQKTIPAYIFALLFFLVIAILWWERKQY